MEIRRVESCYLENGDIANLTAGLEILNNLLISDVCTGEDYVCLCQFCNDAIRMMNVFLASKSVIYEADIPLRSISIKNIISPKNIKTLEACYQLFGKIFEQLDDRTFLADMVEDCKDVLSNVLFLLYRI